MKAGNVVVIHVHYANHMRIRKLDRPLIKQLTLLIDTGNRVLNSFNNEGLVSGYHKDETLTQQWLTMCLTFLTKRLGAESEYLESFKSIVTVPKSMRIEDGFRVAVYEPNKVRNLLGILLAAKSDIEKGYLLKVEQLIRAEAFADIHEQATHLLDNGYKDGAAVLFGAVLESALRKLCKRQSLAIALNEAIDSMNIKLASGAKPLYSKFVQKQITAWADIRNNAAHGHFDKYSEKDVEDMGKWISNFLQEHKP